MTNALIESGEDSLIIMLIDAMELPKSDVGKLKGLKSIINHFVPKRWEFCRAHNNN
jgi:hypothetical protein